MNRLPLKFVSWLKSIFVKLWVEREPDGDAKKRFTQEHFEN